MNGAAPPGWLLGGASSSTGVVALLGHRPTTHGGRAIPPVVRKDRTFRWTPCYVRAVTSPEGSDSVGSSIHSVRLTQAGAAFVVLGCLLLLAFQLWTSGRGLDLLDESYSLSLASQPGASIRAGDVFLYGFVVHPLFLLAGQDIATYRVLGLAILVAAAIWMVVEVELNLRGRGVRVARSARPVLILVVAVSTISVLAVRSPGYRSLALVGMMLAVAALARMSRGHPASGGLLLGLAGVLVFTGKPTSAAALAVAAVIYLLVERAAGLRAILWTALGLVVPVIGLSLTSGLSPVGLYGFLLRGYGQVSAYDSYQSVWSMLGLGAFNLQTSVRAAVVLWLLVAVPAALVFVLLSRLAPGVRVVGTLIVLVLGTAAATWVAMQGLVEQGFGVQVQPVTLVIPLLALLLLARNRWSSRTSGDTVEPSRVPWSLVVLLLAMPYISAVGTNTLFAYTMAQAAVFWTLAVGVVIVSTTPSMQAQADLMVVSMGVVFALVGLGSWVWFADGGSDDSDLAARTPVAVAGGVMRVTADDAVALDEISEVRSRYRLDPSTPSVDLTGISAGYQFQLGTHALGRPSYYGFFAGAEKAARVGLSLETCRDKAAAWLLYADDNPNDISGAHTLGTLDLANDYERVGSFSPSQGLPEWKSLTVQILRPRATVRDKLDCS